MKKCFSTYVIVLLGIFFVFQDVKAQQSNFEQDFMALDALDKLTYYENLNDSLKKVHADFFIKNSKTFENNYKTNELLKRLKFTNARLNYFAGNYIESINILNTLITQKDYPLKQQDSMDVYDELKKSYYKLKLYPEIFEVNAKIKQLIGRGAEYPLWTYNMNSLLYARLLQYDKATKALQEEIDKLKQIKNRDSLILPSAYNDLGYYFFETKKNDSALLNFQRSLAYAERSLKLSNKDLYERLTAVVKGNIAEVYMRKKKYSKAVNLLKEDIRVGVATKNNMVSTFYSYSLLVNCYLELKEFNKAESVIAEAEQYIPLLTSRIPVVDFYINKSNFFEKSNEIDSANFYLKKAFKIKDSLSVKGMNDILASNELIHNITEKQRLIEKHQVALKNQELHLKNKQKNILVLFALLLSFLLALSLFVVFKLKKNRHEIKIKNGEIIQKNKEIAKALLEKDVLLKEVHHRVKNNLQVISGLLELQNVNITDESVKLALKEGQNRIQSVALVHKMMYQSDNMSKVNMEKYFKELVQVLASSYAKADKNIITSINANGVDLDITLAVPLSLIVNEAVCNAYKHAFVEKKEGKIDVSVTQLHNKQFQLTIKDDGVGLPENFSKDSIKSIGFDLIKGLTKQLKGKLNVKGINGTEIIISFLDSEKK